MSGTRTTRSGAIFSPWEVSRCYETPVSLSALAVSISTVTERAEEIDGGPIEQDSSDRKAAARVQEAPIEYVALEGVGDIHRGEAPSNDASMLRVVGLDRDSASDMHADEGCRGVGLAAVPLDCDQPDSVVSSRMERESHGVRLGLEKETEPVDLRERMSTNPLPSGNGLSRAERTKARANAHKHGKRRESRKKAQEAAGLSVKQVTMKRAAQSRVVPLDAINASHLPHTQRGYVGLVARKTQVRMALSDREKASTLSELLDMGFQYIPWNGDSGIGILDCERRLVVGGGMPRGEDWTECTKRCADTIEAIRAHCKFTTKHIDHSRGPFPAMAHGIAYGQGQLRPMIHTHSKTNEMVFNTLLANSDMIRIAGFQSHLLASFAPDLNQQYKEVLDGVLQNQSELKRNFPNSNYATITVNFGPQTVSTPHIDVADLAYGLCAITALGDFNPDLGGHLVLWDLNVVIRFPPGSTLLVPSAIVRHSNLAIQPTEKRYSVTQYSAGSLFRWFNNGFRSDKEVACSQAELGEPPNDDYLQSQWESGLSKLRRYT